MRAPGSRLASRITGARCAPVIAACACDSRLKNDIELIVPWHKLQRVVSGAFSIPPDTSRSEGPAERGQYSTPRAPVGSDQVFGRTLQMCCYTGCKKVCFTPVPSSTRLGEAPWVLAKSYPGTCPGSFAPWQGTRCAASSPAIRSEGVMLRAYALEHML